MYTRFAITTPFETINFAIEDLSKLQHFVCGLRHLARRPIERREFLWQRTLAVNKEAVEAQSFDNKLNSLTGFLQTQKSALEQLAGMGQPR